MKIYLLTLLLALSFAGLSQSIGTSQIKDGAITEPKLAANALRPVDGGTLSNFALVFGPDYRKKYSLPVTSDIALTLSGSTQTADSYIFISTIPDGTHAINFPSDWIIKSSEPGTGELELNNTSHGIVLYPSVYIICQCKSF